MAGFEQESHLLAVETPLGKDKLLLEAFSGLEEMSRPFSFQLTLLSHDQAIAAADIVGKSLTVTVQSEGGSPRHFHGHVARLAAGELAGRNFRRYHATVVPWLWFLSKRHGCRIFQEKSVLEIAEQIFGELDRSDFETTNVRGSPPKLEYCVQYRETDLQFLSRLFEEHGIYYYFRHEEKKHVLVLADAKVGYVDCEEKEVICSPGSLTTDHVTKWEHGYAFVSGAWAHADYNFETPLTKLRSSAKTVVELPGVDPFEVYDYPGRYPDGSAGDARVQVRMEEEEVGWDVVDGSSTCRSFTVGGKFKVVEHECANEEGKEYVLVALRHEATDASLAGDGSASASYSNGFRCIPASVVYRPPLVTPKAVVRGPQTAVVVGPAGEEIYTDKYGRVKVQFHWDREGESNEKSSCWVRVAQHWAGKSWGAVFNPRIGQEVVVDFLEGDPDRPLITGRVYNADQTPPYEVPANQTQSGVKTRSSKGGSGDNFNELRFEDKKGEEQIFLHAERNQDIEVEKDETHSVGNNRTKTIGNDETTQVKNNRTETVDKEETITIHGNRTETVDKNETITISGGRTESVTKDETITISGGRTENVSKDESVSIGQKRSLTVSGDETVTVSGSRNESVSKGETISVGENRSHSVGKNDQLEVTKMLVINAGDEITLQAGSAKVVLNKNGDIQIEGKNITLKGSGDVVIKGSKISSN